MGGVNASRMKAFCGDVMLAHLYLNKPFNYFNPPLEKTIQPTEQKIFNKPDKLKYSKASKPYMDTIRPALQRIRVQLGKDIDLGIQNQLEVSKSDSARLIIAVQDLTKCGINCGDLSKKIGQLGKKPGVVKEAAEFVVDHPGLVTTAAMVAGAVTWGLANFVFDAPEDYSTAEIGAEATIDSTLEDFIAADAETDSTIIADDAGTVGTDAGETFAQAETESNSFSNLIKDIEKNPNNWTKVSQSVVDSTKKGNAGGQSIEEEFVNNETGQTIYKHTLTDANGKLLEQPHYRPYSKQ